MLSRILVCLLLWTATAAQAQSARTEHTFKLDDPANQPPATLADVGLLVGSWTGEAFGAEIEEVWNPPSAGSMVGMFKVVRDGAVEFYELMLLVEVDDSIALKVKHFASDFTAWENKGEYLTFPLVRVDENAVHFSGLSFYRLDENRINGYIAMRGNDGLREEELTYRRADAPAK